MKKIISLIIALTVCLGLVFTGCGRGDGKDPTLEGVEFSTRTGEMYKDTKAGKKRIKFSYTPGYGDNWIRQIARRFLLSDAGANYYMVLDNDSELTTSVSSKLEDESGAGLSDIYYPLASNWQSYAALDYLENLDDLYAATPDEGSDETILDKMHGEWKNGYGRAVNHEETHYYIFPGNENITGIVYNKTMFDKYGWEVPTTTAELKALCDKILKDTNNKVAPFVYPGTITGGYWDFVGTNWWLQVTGLEKMNEFMSFESTDVFNPTPSTSPSYGKKQMLRTFEELIVKNSTTYTLRGSGGKDHKQAQISFLQGQAAMIPNGNWIENESLTSMKDEFRMMPTPKMANARPNENYNYSGQPDYIFIPKKAGNKEGAKAFLKFMCSDEILKLYTSLCGTPRPFDYDISECDTTDFAKSCLEIWENSVTWFESSTSKLWTANKVKKFNASNPYTNLITNAGTVSADGWCSAEYNSVQTSWPQWLQQVGLA